jgi:hypothetical protein
MTYHLTLNYNFPTTQIYSEFENQFNPPLKIKPNSYIQVNNIYIKKNNDFNVGVPNGNLQEPNVYIYIKELTSLLTYNCNQVNSTNNGYVYGSSNFGAVGSLVDDELFINNTSSKLPLNNQTELNINQLTIQLKDKLNNFFSLLPAPIGTQKILRCSISISITDNIKLLD